MAIVCATVTARIDSLLCILKCEVYVVASFTEVGRAQDACVSISNVKATRITCILIGVPLHQIGVWGRVHMLLALLCWGEVHLPSCGWGGKDIACRERAIGRQCPASAKQWRGLTCVNSVSARSILAGEKLVATNSIST